LLTGQTDVENPYKNYRFSNIESTATCKHHVQNLSPHTLPNLKSWIQGSGLHKQIDLYPLPGTNSSS